MGVREGDVTTEAEVRTGRTRSQEMQVASRNQKRQKKKKKVLSCSLQKKLSPTNIMAQ